MEGGPRFGFEYHSGSREVTEGVEALSPEQEKLAQKAAEKLRQEPELLEKLDLSTHIDTLLAKLIEGGAELEPGVRKILAARVRMLLGLPEQVEEGAE